MFGYLSNEYSFQTKRAFLIAYLFNLVIWDTLIVTTTDICMCHTIFKPKEIKIKQTNNIFIYNLYKRNLI